MTYFLEFTFLNLLLLQIRFHFPFTRLYTLQNMFFLGDLLSFQPSLSFFYLHRTYQPTQSACILSITSTPLLLSILILLFLSPTTNANTAHTIIAIARRPIPYYLDIKNHDKHHWHN